VAKNSLVIVWQEDVVRHAMLTQSPVYSVHHVTGMSRYGFLVNTVGVNEADAIEVLLPRN